MRNLPDNFGETGVGKDCLVMTCFVFGVKSVYSGKKEFLGLQIPTCDFCKSWLDWPFLAYSSYFLFCWESLIIAYALKHSKRSSVLQVTTAVCLIVTDRFFKVSDGYDSNFTLKIVVCLVSRALYSLLSTFTPLFSIVTTIDLML